jgi:hypothetical protein
MSNGSRICSRRQPTTSERAEAFWIEKDDAAHGRRAKQDTRESKRWALVAAAIMLATFSLLYSIDANRRAESLQQRLNALEIRAGK